MRILYKSVFNLQWYLNYLNLYFSRTCASMVCLAFATYSHEGHQPNQKPCQIDIRHRFIYFRQHFHFETDKRWITNFIFIFFFIQIEMMVNIGVKKHESFIFRKCFPWASFVEYDNSNIHSHKISCSGLLCVYVCYVKWNNGLFYLKQLVLIVTVYPNFVSFQMNYDNQYMMVWGDCYTFWPTIQKNKYRDKILSFYRLTLQFHSERHYVFLLIIPISMY